MKFSFSSSVLPMPATARRANAAAASTKVGSLSSVSACCGVFETVRVAVHSSREGASKLASIGCRNVRCQCT